MVSHFTIYVNLKAKSNRNLFLIFCYPYAAFYPEAAPFE